MGRICAFIGCSNSVEKLSRWYDQTCQYHGKKNGSCICLPPFQLFPFPSQRKNPEGRRSWVKLINRKAKDGKNWQPKPQDRVCSRHFKENEPTALWPNPTENLGYHFQSTGSAKSPRQPPKERAAYSDVKKTRQRKRKDTPHTCTSSSLGEGDAQDVCPAEEDSIPCKKSDIALAEHDYFALGSTHDKLDITAEEALKHHEYCKVRDKTKCPECALREECIDKMETDLTEIRHKLEREKAKRANFDITGMVLASDARVNSYTGIASKQKLECLHSFLAPKAKKMRYWTGQKSSPSASPRSSPRVDGKKTPQKPGPSRMLDSKQEFILTLMKLRLALTMSFLGCLFGISVATTSRIFNTWIKLLAQELRSLIVWPNQFQCRSMIPTSLRAKYKHLRCTIDCTELFIARPRDLYNQAATWSDYKHHNTVKFLVAIAPNGAISFLSKAWGGRASDVLITRESGFLNLIDAGDVILADRGFIIKEDLLLRHASLEIPPPSKGKEQHTPEQVAKTKVIANARIHVERAIGRMKTFLILGEQLPVSMIPLIDDIIVVIAALVNLRPPLVK